MRRRSPFAIQNSSTVSLMSPGLHRCPHLDDDLWDGDLGCADPVRGDATVSD
jgi:hypothetical protein